MDPYWWEQSQQRIARNKARQAELQKVRDQEYGNKIHGNPTPFLESFDSAGQAPMSTVGRDDNGVPLEEPHPLPTSPEILNYQLSRAELEQALAESYQLTKPVPSAMDTPEMIAEDERVHEEKHRKAALALERITSMDNASSTNRLHANIRRCVETFGRHNTDKFLRPKPLTLGAKPVDNPPRSGPDTGSSEVQIAILTAKIRVLAQMYEGRKGNKDKFNKRNLRVLLHRRQKLLKYMERRERGSERWTHMLATLGLTPATWKDEITLQ